MATLVPGGGTIISIPFLVWGNAMATKYGN